MYRPVRAVWVRLWGQDVGALAQDPSTGFYAFEYHPAWLTRGIEFAPLTMPMVARVHSFPDLAQATFQRLPAAIADALPDAFGNAIVTEYLARQGVAAGAITPLDRLAYQGKRGMGALEFAPQRGPSERVATAVELGSLVQAARTAVSGQVGRGATERGLRALIRVGTSAGGARAKAVVAWNRDTGELRSGQVPAPPGFEHWLIKFDGLGPDAELGVGGGYGRVEYAYSLMARAAGIDLPATHLLEESGRAHFMVRRFDRGPDGGKLHLQSLCGLMGLDFNAIGVHGYSQLFGAVDALGLGPDARSEVFRRASFNVAAANCDDHTKNHGFLMDSTGSWSLSPAYDVTHAYNPEGRWTYQHLMSVEGEFANIAKADLRTMAVRHRVPGPRQILGKVAEAMSRWPEFAAEAGLSPDRAEKIARDFREVA
ncbi:MAG: type II toxin-antitoxin system HipA family toxin [Bifidobacteriaceae bacterium]|jgi:serine/threonine-protein kinase HipA|nr:type II toxin-antitoxin system HipA family toxin [Bifidobacteriaceae bacterium]